MEKRTVFALALLLAACLGAGLTSAASAQLEQAPSDPALFDIELAQAQLEGIESTVSRLRSDLATALDDLDGLTIQRNAIALNDQARSEQLQRSRTRARQMAVNAYIGIGPPMPGVVILDAESANDLSYRNGLLRHQAERLQNAAATYAVLAGEADIAVLGLSDEINARLRRAEDLTQDLARQVEKLPEAQATLTIARIHDEADRVFARTGRPEPTAEQWRELRFCESTETYAIDSGNTFFGAYQFTWETWGTVGGQDNPAHAPPAEQDARARLLYADRGSQPWPICGRFLP